MRLGLVQVSWIGSVHDQRSAGWLWPPPAVHGCESLKKVWTSSPHLQIDRRIRRSAWAGKVIVRSSVMLFSSHFRCSDAVTLAT
ncbi:hypothetical protein HMPREF9567_00859 [Cutibacterium acnes HL013PA1]|nr:hypothetical protein HMPREF9567_00859 [Cutibacterium acnes HL013PA1]